MAVNYERLKKRGDVSLIRMKERAASFAFSERGRWDLGGLSKQVVGSQRSDIAHGGKGAGPMWEPQFCRCSAGMAIRLQSRAVHIPSLRVKQAYWRLKALAEAMQSCSEKNEKNEFSLDRFRYVTFSDLSPR